MCQTVCNKTVSTQQPLTTPEKRLKNRFLTIMVPKMVPNSQNLKFKMTNIKK